MTASRDNAAYFSVTVQPSGRSFNVPAGDTLLAAGVQQGIALPYGCKDGACGSCKCRLISGTVLHGPHQEKALSAQEESQGFVLTCCAMAQSDLVLESLQVTALNAFAVKKMPTRLTSIQKKSADVLVLQLQLPANENFQYHAGQYIDILLRDGTRRSYSIANAPQNGQGIELHVRHMPGGKFTDHAFGTLQEKEILRIEGPYGSFFLREDSTKPIVLLASGTGFAPIKALLEHMQKQATQRPVYFYWGGKRPADLYMHAWVQEQCHAMPNLHYVPVLSNAQVQDQWQGRTGLVHLAVLEDFPDLSGYQVYACGAPIVVESAHKDFCLQGNLPTEEFFSDAFTSAADKAANKMTA